MDMFAMFINGVIIKRQFKNSLNHFLPKRGYMFCFYQFSRGFVQTFL